MPAHCDHYGHMNVRHYAAFFDDAGWYMFACAGVSLSDLNSRGLGSVVATLTIDFHHEITAGQLAVIRGAFTRVGTKSFEYALELYEADSIDALRDAEDRRGVFRHREAQVSPSARRYPREAHGDAGRLTIVNNRL